MTATKQIRTSQDFKKIKDNLGGAFELVSDVDLSRTSLRPIGTKNKPFTGTLDGKGHTVYIGSKQRMIFGHVRAGHGIAIKSVYLKTKGQND